MLAMTRRLLLLIPLVLLFPLVLAACDQPVTIIVVTATPGAPVTATAEVTAEPTQTQTPTAEPTQTPTETPTAAPTQTATPELIQVTLPPSIQITPLVTAGPSPTWLGPVVGEGYVAPASATPAAPATIGPVVEGAPTVAALAVTAGASPTPGQVPVMPNLDPNKVGVQLDINLSQDDWSYAMGRLEQLGVEWIKVQLPWKDMQPDGPNGRNDEFFARVEQYLEDASKRGFSVLVSIVKAPAWARSTQAEDGPPDNPQDLANFISIVLNEINAGLARPMLGDYIDAVEVWNEPNLLREWQGRLPFNGAGYMQLFGPAYQAVRDYSPTIAVLTGGLAPTSTSAYSVDDRDFLRQMFAAGLGNYADVGIGVHPYGWGNPPDAECCNAVDGQGWDDDPHFFFADTMREYREIIASNGRSGNPLWITELGWASWDGFPGGLPDGDDWMAYNDRWDQGFNMIRAFEINQASPDVVMTALWNLNFATLAGMIENRDERAAYSILAPGESCNIIVGSANRTERPLFWMLFDALHIDQTLTDWCGVPPAR